MGYSLSEDDPVDLFLFSDASKRAYGYVAYAVQNGNANFILAKPKVAPLKRKSLSQLELLSAFVALQGLLNMLHDFIILKTCNIFKRPCRATKALSNSNCDRDLRFKGATLGFAKIKFALPFCTAY